MLGKALTLAMAMVFTIAFSGIASEISQDAVNVMEGVDAGKYLVDGKGMTLYTFKKDSPGKSACTGPCVEKWPLYYADTLRIPDGVKSEDFGAITREDGKRQRTYKGRPLYYYVGDKRAGDMTGQGMGGVWYIVKP